MRYTHILLLCALVLGACAGPRENPEYSGIYTGKKLDHIAFPLGGIGSGMMCIEGTGCISNVSLYHCPDVFNEPRMFSAISVKGYENGAKVLEGMVPDYKIFGSAGCALGRGETSWGLPRFENCEFRGRFPFADITLQDDDIPLDVKICAWSPFIPNDEDNSSLPAACLEYSFTNNTDKTLEALYAFSSENFMDRSYTVGSIERIENGFLLNAVPAENEPGKSDGHCAIFTDRPGTVVDACGFRGGWFDGLSIQWKKIATCDYEEVPPQEHYANASLYVPLTIRPGGTETVRLSFVWYVPGSDIEAYSDAQDDNERGPCYNPALYKDIPEFYEPWYSHRFSSVMDAAEYWKTNVPSLRERSKLFSDTFFASTLPAEVVDAIASNLSILKSTTILRQHDGRLYCYEGTGDSWGSCPGTTTHVWNYTQALPHLFPALERTLRETEFYVDQALDGHQAFRGALPIRPVRHTFLSAADGQLGGITKVYRDWRIYGNDQWLKDIFPLVKSSMDYCIRTWDPDRKGAILEPHHNTYDIEFWGADPLCTSFYISALDSYVAMCDYLGEDSREYRDLLDASVSYMKTNLWNGEYFYQVVDWKNLHAGSPIGSKSYGTSYSPEALAILEKEGPKYQYGTGCISDGMIGFWMSLAAGREEVLEKGYVKSHLNSIYKYNFKKDLSDHACAQRPTYGGRHDAGTLLCSWPRGGKPSLPFVYSDEVWTGIEYEVAAHLMFEGEVEKGCELVRAVRDRYDGSVRNPYNEYECGAWYARALSGYSMLQALTGVRYDAVEKTLYIDSRIGGNFTSFLSTAYGFASVGLKNGKPFVEVKEGNIPIDKILVSGKQI